MRYWWVSSFRFVPKPKAAFRAGADFVLAIARSDAGLRGPFPSRVLPFYRTQERSKDHAKEAFLAHLPEIG